MTEPVASPALGEGDSYVAHGTAATWEHLILIGSRLPQDQDHRGDCGTANNRDSGITRAKLCDFGSCRYGTRDLALVDERARVRGLAWDFLPPEAPLNTVVIGLCVNFGSKIHRTAGSHSLSGRLPTTLRKDRYVL